MPLMESILEATGNERNKKCSLIVIDPKNELAGFVREALSRVGRSDDLIVVQPGESWYNPLSSPFLTEAEMPEKIITWASNTNRSVQRRSTGDGEYWANAQRALLSAIIGTTRAIHGKLTFTLLNQVFRQIEGFRKVGEASRWLEMQQVPEAAIRGITEYLALPLDTTRPCVSNSVSSVLYFWASEPLSGLTTENDDLPGIDPVDIIHEGKVVVVGCSGSAYGVSITPFLLALKEHFFGVLLSRDQVEVKDGETWIPINQTRPVFVVADEFQAYVSPDSSAGEFMALDRLRGFNAGMLCATQSLSSLESVLGASIHATRLVSLLSNQLFLSNICPSTAIQAEHILGKKKVKNYQTDCSRQIPAPVLFRTTRGRAKRSHGHRIAFTHEVPRVDAGTLAAMKTGQFWARLADGTVHTKKAPFISINSSK